MLAAFAFRASSVRFSDYLWRRPERGISRVGFHNSGRSSQLVGGRQPAASAFATEGVSSLKQVASREKTRIGQCQPLPHFLARRVWNGIFVAGDRRAEKGLNISAQRLEIGDCRAREMPVKAAFPLADLDAWVSAGFSSAMILNSSAGAEPRARTRTMSPPIATPCGSCSGTP
jgi:hypothetical protein